MATMTTLQMSEDTSSVFPSSKLMNGDTLNVSEKNEVFVLQRKGVFTYETRQTPELPSKNHVLVRIIATGICGSDVHYWKHGRLGPFTVSSPLILGHESSGLIVRCGSAVKSHKIGDRVAIEPGVPCRSCSFCRSGKYNLCDSMKFAATPPVDGTLATYYCLPEDFCYRLPEHVGIEEGALVEPLAVAVHCARLAGVGMGQSVLVMGAGPIGLLCCAVVRAFGARRVVVTDIVEERLVFAAGYAATNTYMMRRVSGEENARNIVEGCAVEGGADVVIDATGVESCISAGVFALKKGGVFVQAGLGASDIVFPVGELCSKEGLYKATFRYGPGDYELAIQLLESRKISLKELITHSYEFSRAEQAFAETGKNGGIKSIIYGPRT